MTTLLNTTPDFCLPGADPVGGGDRMTDQERLSLSVETIELAKLAAELRQAGRRLEADRVAIRVAENSGRLAAVMTPSLALDSVVQAS